MSDADIKKSIVKDLHKVVRKLEDIVDDMQRNIRDFREDDIGELSRVAGQIYQIAQRA